MFSRTPIQPPHCVGEKGKVTNSLLTEGCQIDGEVDHSVLFHSVTVEPGAKVQYSIIMPGATIKKGAKVSYAIIAEGAVIEDGAKVGAAPKKGGALDIAVVASDTKVGKKATVAPAAMVTKNVKEGGKA